MLLRSSVRGVPATMTWQRRRAGERAPPLISTVTIITGVKRQAGGRVGLSDLSYLSPPPSSSPRSADSNYSSIPSHLHLISHITLERTPIIGATSEAPPPISSLALPVKKSPSFPHPMHFPVSSSLSFPPTPPSSTRGIFSSLFLLLFFSPLAFYGRILKYRLAGKEGERGWYGIGSDVCLSDEQSVGPTDYLPFRFPFFATFAPLSSYSISSSTRGPSRPPTPSCSSSLVLQAIEKV